MEMYYEVEEKRCANGACCCELRVTEPAAPILSLDFAVSLVITVSSQDNPKSSTTGRTRQPQRQHVAARTAQSPIRLPTWEKSSGAAAPALHDAFSGPTFAHCKLESNKHGTVRAEGSKGVPAAEGAGTIGLRDWAHGAMAASQGGWQRIETTTKTLLPSSQPAGLPRGGNAAGVRPAAGRCGAALRCVRSAGLLGTGRCLLFS